MRNFSSIARLATLLAIAGLAGQAEQAKLQEPAAALYRKAQGGRWFAQADRLKPEIVPTTDGRSFLVLWRASTNVTRWIVSLHGTGGFATDDLALWSPTLRGRPVGFIGVQWWLGTGDARGDYYAPEQIYREVDRLLHSLGAEPGRAMLHGFSRGSANSYAVMALDAGRGRRYFSLAVANSGGVGLDYPPTRALLAGDYGEQPLRGTRWVTCAGARDPNPDRDGIPGMRRTAAWLEEQGAVVLEKIEDPAEGHGALQRNPKNAQRVVELLLR